MSALKLYGRDKADVDIISSYMQDALVRIGDMARLAVPPRFVLMASRFCWEYERAPMRVRVALQIGNVVAMRHKNISRDDGGAILSLLAVQFEASAPPAGRLSLIFADGAQINLEVEACEIIMEDVSDRWGVKTRPTHEI